MEKSAQDIVIVAARRTPIGSLLGCLSQYTAVDLGTIAVQALLSEDDLLHQKIQDVYMGCVLTAGLGQAPARQVALNAGLDAAVRCMTINKVCGSGMATVMMAYDQLRLGQATAIVAGGMESMSQAPFIIPGARTGFKYGHQKMIDHMAYDGLENAYDHQAMGVFAEQCARQYRFSREAQDEYAVESVRRARLAIEQGSFKSEIVEFENAKANLINTDEQPGRCKPEKVAKLRPAFVKESGTVTAANSSSISDGAAAVLLCTRAWAEQQQMQPLAKLVGHASYAKAPDEFTTAPIGAMQALLSQLDWHVSDVDLFEINEAFAVVPMAAIQDMKLDVTKVNVHGGACAMGHPIGASGTRILVTLLYALHQYSAQRGMASLCIGGGEATAIAIEVEEN
ncbi:3-ketoacyl-CoA thiolase @ Acetyl-CoA acetyltransferase [hydrothermal vent metagenome]|uniref:3-ketoacyl-CoA thiolase @ Acetyl-CoA acetyltransferase n=1 Tax=hydrothermal vent metagenome TaxID=652676 RepID=A0A3B0Z4N5_9ZZZZ